MIGIYEDKFIDFLKDRLDGHVKVTNKNIIVQCPFCEYDKKKKHYHLYIALESPIFHCFGSDCHQKGTIKKFLEKLEGKDLTDSFVDKTKIKESVKEKIQVEIEKPKKELYLPKIDEDRFKLKSMYMKKRLKFSNENLSSIKGLIFDVNSFLDSNLVPINETLFKIRDYLHSNFVGFLTEFKSIVVFRNIDPSADMGHFKMYIQNSPFLDYYRIGGSNKLSNNVVLSEGIFDILVEHIFDSTNLRNSTALYACGLSTSYDSLIKSIVFNEQKFRLNVSILSDIDIKLDYYRKIKKLNQHVIENMNVFYNKNGKDFADSPSVVEKFIV